ncbi:unnamed protein product [Caenorhabditis auriculariae]|uniref:Protein kinase domain-containing protein n=1 Tax=Caenorhabditis auriculariae TaxID=2777116 RepID=A0A8S1HVJ0_9PELO|nr:unnamed protein product [Caenorhabditis auriculariae]
MSIRHMVDKLKGKERFQGGSESNNVSTIVPAPFETHELLVPVPLPVVDHAEQPEKFLKKWPGFHGYIPDLDARKMICHVGDYIIRLENDECNTWIILTVGERMVEDPFWADESKGGDDDKDGNENEDDVVPIRAKTYVIELDHFGVTLDGENYFDSVDNLLSFYIFHSDKSSLDVQLLYAVPRKMFEFEPEDVRIIKNLGSGQFGDVCLAAIDRPGLLVQSAAVKSLKRGSANASELSRKLIEEGRVMLELEHPNVVQILGWCIDEHPFKLIIEFLPGGSLDMFIIKHYSVTSMKRQMFFAVGIAQGLEYIHANRVLHRDIAARNVLLASDGTPKISDFGLAVRAACFRMKEAEKVPLRYLSPEVLTHFIFSQKSDVYAYGVLLFELFTGGSIPYEGLLSQSVRQCILSGTYNQFPEGTPPKLVNYVEEKVWAYEPIERPMMDEIIEYLEGLMCELEKEGAMGIVTDAVTDEEFKDRQPNESEQRRLLELRKGDRLEELCPTQDETISRATQASD